MSRRTTFESNWELAVINQKCGYFEFNQEFRQFCPDLQMYVKNNFEVELFIQDPV